MLVKVQERPEFAFSSIPIHRKKISTQCICDISDRQCYLNLKEWLFMSTHVWDGVELTEVERLTVFTIYFLGLKKIQ